MSQSPAAKLRMNQGESRPNRLRCPLRPSRRHSGQINPSGSSPRQSNMNRKSSSPAACCRWPGRLPRAGACCRWPPRPPRAGGSSSSTAGGHAGDASSAGAYGREARDGDGSRATRGRRNATAAGRAREREGGAGIQLAHARRGRWRSEQLCIDG